MEQPGLLLLGIIAGLTSAKAPAILFGLVMQAVQFSLKSGSSVPSASLFSTFGVNCKLRENRFHYLIPLT